MIKKSLKLLFVSVLALGLSGCGSSDDSNNDGGSGSEPLVQHSDGGSETNPFAQYRPSAAKDVWIKKVTMKRSSYIMVHEYSKFDDKYGPTKQDSTFTGGVQTITEFDQINESKTVATVKQYFNDELVEKGSLISKEKNLKSYERFSEFFDIEGNLRLKSTRKEFKWEGPICKGYTDYIETIDVASRKDVMRRKVKDMKIIESQLGSRQVVTYAYDDGLILDPSRFLKFNPTENNPFLPSRIGNVNYTVTFYDNGLVKTWQGSDGASTTYEYINKEDAKNESK